MKRLMILGAVCALAVAKPELYKEKEDFQFSRSSSDDGSKSGYYGAQRGNMGGNYERAHNMDSLAQNQMSGLVRQVEGELGDGARQRTGSVYTAANSRGTYGSGHYDLSNLGGRNFQEGTSYGDSHLQSANSASSAYNAAGYTNSHSHSSRNSGYQATGYSGLTSGHSGLATGYSGLATGHSGLATGHSGLATGHSGLATGHLGVNLQSDNLQAIDHTQGAGQFDYGTQTSHAAGYNAQSGYQQHAAYDTSNTNLHSAGYGSNVNTRLVSGTPVRIVIRPGTRVFVPVAAQTYDTTHGSSVIDQNSLNSNAEVLSNDNQHNVYRPSNAKHYESSYNYRKEWEKHDTIPATIISPTTTDNPFPKNSELYEDGQAHVSSQYDARRVDSQRAHSAYGGYNANVKSTSGQSRFNYDAQRNGASLTNTNAYSGTAYGATHAGTSSDSSLNANAYNAQSQYNGGRYQGASSDASLQAAAGVHNTGYTAADLNSQVENLNSKPKSYQSAYSYHKSWERQGDPYVIKPASGAYYDGQSAQRLTTGSSQNLGYASTGSHYQHSHRSDADCDETEHIRLARSYNTDQFQETQQQSQNLEDFGQQQQSQNLEDFGQQQQNQNLEDFGQQQQSQNLEDFGQHQQSQNLEDFGQQQQSQNLEEFGQQQQSQNLDYFGQQQQNKNLEDLAQQEHKKQLEDLGQQVENGQQAEVVWDAQQEGGQQAENTWDNLENLSQQSQKKWDDVNHTWDKFEDLGQKPQDIEKQVSNVEQNNQNGHGLRTQNTEIEQSNIREDQQTDKWSFNQQSEDNQQQNVSTNNKDHEQSDKFNLQETQPQLSDGDIFNYFQQSQKQNNDQKMSVWDKFDIHSIQNTQQNKYNSEQTNSNSGQVNWSLVPQQTSLDQQPITTSGTKPDNSQTVQHKENNGSTSVPITSNSQQMHNIPETNEQSDLGYFNFNAHTNQNQFWNAENSFQETHKLHQSSNSYSSYNHRQEHTTNVDSYSHANAFDTISPNTAPLASIWDKLDKFEHTLLPANVDKVEGNTNSQVQTGTQKSFDDFMHTYHNMESTSQEHLNAQNMKPIHDLLHVVEKDRSQNKSKSEDTDIETSLDVGRGDVSPEDFLDVKLDTPVSSETIQNQDENSLKNNTNVQNFSRDVQHHQTTQGQSNIHQHTDFYEQQDAQSKEQQNLHVLSLHKNIDQQNIQDSKHNLEQHNVQDREESLVQQKAQGFAQQENVEQQNLQDFGKQDNLEQQNLQDFGQQVNLDQQNLHDFGKQDNMEQQNLQDFGQQVNVDQQNLHDFGKQENLEQQNIQDFAQQVNVDQQNLHDFGKQDNLEQQNLQDFGQQVNVDQQNLHDFGKQDNLEQQNLQDFGQQVNVDQLNLNDFGQQVNFEQQNLHEFGQQDNLEQQNLQEFGQQVNSEQQNLQDFGQQVNLDQQNLHSFGKQDNFEQQNSQDFGQQAYLDQHNLEHFESQDNLQQQNKNLEQFSEDSIGLKHPKEERTALPSNNEQLQSNIPPEVVEQPIVKKQNNVLQSVSSSTEVSPVEPVTEPAGFWKSIGNKFTKAKSKIASWF